MEETLSALLVRLRDQFSHVRLTLPLPVAPQTKQWTLRALNQLDDYIMPRLRSIEAPLLAVVGGSTGAGKSTLVNSLLGRPVSTVGVIRPTTKTPVLVHHPLDLHWFNDDRILPELARSSEPSDSSRRLQLVESAAIPEGLAILDAPDIDSVDLDNRHLAAQLLSAADLWLFVTSAARYADAVPWDYLIQAGQRHATVAVVIDRVPPVAMSVVPEHLAEMMTERGLGDSPLFAVPETVVDSQGLLPWSAIRPIRSWLDYLASNQITRARVVMNTLNGAIAGIEAGAEIVAEQIAEQNRAIARLETDARAIFDETKTSVRSQSCDGSLLRGEVMARWQDFVGTGEVMRSVESGIGRFRDRVTRMFSGNADKAVDVRVAVKSSIETLLINAGQSACERVENSWSAGPAGRYVIEWSGADVGAVSVDFPAQVAEAIRGWQDDVMAVVEQEGAGRRTKARLAALGVNAAGVSLMLVAFAHTAGVTGAELGIASGTAVVAQKVLELIFGDDQIRRLATVAEERLGARMDAVLDNQLNRLLEGSVRRFPVETVDPGELVAVAGEMGEAREAEMRKLEDFVVERTNTAPSPEPVLQGGDRG